MNEMLREKCDILNEKAAVKPMIDVCFYRKDNKNLSKTKKIAIGAFEGFDKGNLLLSNGMEIPLADIISIEGEIFCK